MDQIQDMASYPQRWTEQIPCPQNVQSPQGLSGPTHHRSMRVYLKIIILDRRMLKHPVQCLLWDLTIHVLQAIKEGRPGDRSVMPGYLALPWAECVAPGKTSALSLLGFSICLHNFAQKLVFRSEKIASPELQGVMENRQFKFSLKLSYSKINRVE